MAIQRTKSSLFKINSIMLNIFFLSSSSLYSLLHSGSCSLLMKMKLEGLITNKMFDTFPFFKKIIYVYVKDSHDKIQTQQQETADYKPTELYKNK